MRHLPRHARHVFIQYLYNICMMSTQNKEIKAIHMADLNNLLKKYGQLEDFTSGSMRCQVCNDLISRMNVGSIQFTDGKLAFACNKTSCYGQVVRNTQ